MTNSTRPTHRIFAVQKRSESTKAFWTEIGAAWPNRDGKGFSMRFELLPLRDAEIVMREIKADEDGVK